MKHFKSKQDALDFILSEILFTLEEDLNRMTIDKYEAQHYTDHDRDVMEAKIEDIKSVSKDIVIASHKPKRPTCECADKLCPVHNGKSSCEKNSVTTLYRVDMEDHTGTKFCRGCADDSLESDLFTRERKKT